MSLRPTKWKPFISILCLIPTSLLTLAATDSGGPAVAGDGTLPFSVAFRPAAALTMPKVEVRLLTADQEAQDKTKVCAKIPEAYQVAAGRITYNAREFSVNGICANELAAEIHGTGYGVKIVIAGRIIEHEGVRYLRGQLSEHIGTTTSEKPIILEFQDRDE